MSLSLGKLEKLNLQSDLETLQFAEQQVKDMIAIMEGMAAEQEEIGRLLHLAGFGVITVVTVWAAIGDIRRFAEPKYLVGYAGLGTRIHDSGMTSRSGKTLAPALQVQVSPRRVDGTCAPCWSKPPMQLPTPIPTGRQNWQGWNQAWDGIRRS